MFDPDAFGAAMGELVRDAVTPLHREIADLRKQLSEKPDIDAAVRRVLSEIPVPKDGEPGKDCDMEAVKTMVSEVVAAIPAPVNGKDGEPGKDGASVTIEDVRPIIDEAIKTIRAEADAAIEKAINAIPVPKDGIDGAPGKDGNSVTIEDISGTLELSVSRWALEFERRAQDTIQRALDKIVQPEDGKPGKDGRDGLGFDDLQVEYDGIKTVTFKLHRDDVVKEFNLTLPVVTDCGIFKEGQTYQAGDGVTWAGSYWIAQKETGAKPDSPDSGFRLAVKRGRDGKDGRNGIDKTVPVSLKD